ncbi:unnamed protein product [Arabidopsis arenosa]|uniref:Uncharacterized protein n=1 Tax=Arabidopsis arenosa TaxID=38785 RepID=A0A8S1ZUU7_ARAAE|nr:unnamed protein product [Arabidopsis arenosa]
MVNAPSRTRSKDQTEDEVLLAGLVMVCIQSILSYDNGREIGQLTLQHFPYSKVWNFLQHYSKAAKL